MGKKAGQLRSDFIADLPLKIYELESTAKQLFDSDELLSILSDLHGKIGSIITTSGIIGEVRLTISARSLERMLDEGLQAPALFDEQRRQSFFRQLMSFIHQVRQWLLVSDNQLERITNSEGSTPIYLLDSDRGISKELSLLSNYGYEIITFSSLDVLLDGCSKRIPSAIIVDIAYVPELVEAKSTLQGITPHIPLIVISESGDFSLRLSAVRLGATHFFVQPIDMSCLKATLDGHNKQAPIQPYRVLIIEDDPISGSANAFILEQAGIEVECLYDPLEVFETLECFNPDLILMDIMMPVCNGLELAAIIRQDDSYNAIPIVFLSASGDPGRRLAAMNLGGDELISKTTDAEYLRSVVLSRIKRKRWVERLNHELFTSMRESEYLRVAMNQHVSLSITDVSGKIIFVNDKFSELSGYQADELLGNNHRMLRSGVHDGAFFHNMWRTISNGMVWQGEVCNQTKQGNLRWMETTIVPFLDKEGHPYQYISVRTDITGIKESETVLTQARDEAEKASQAKSEFISHMSHELRTPLNAILGYAQLFEYDQGLDEGQRRCAQEIHRAGEHLLGLVNEVLDLSRIERGYLALKIEQVGLFDLVLECQKLVKPQLVDKAVALEIRGCGYLLLADEIRLKQVLLNLLSNAVKYNRQNGKVWVSCRVAQNERVRIEVKDTGHGLSSAQISQLFQPFNRLGEELGEIEGAGVGLALSRRLIEMMNGCIGVESSEGEGCTFWVELPLATSDDVARQHPLSNMFESLPRKVVKSGIKTLLYIEDNPANTRLMERAVSQLSYLRLQHAATAEDGLRRIHEIKPDLVLMDINLPGMDGYEALSRLQRDPLTREIPVIAITANAMPSEVARGFQAGFVEYITKPLNIKLFLDTVDTMIGAENIEGGASSI